jgi:hypothetical protein
MPRGAGHRLLFTGYLALLGCGSARTDTNQSVTDASGPVIIVSPDGAFRLPNGTCDASAPDDGLAPVDAAEDSGTCTVTNPNVRFQLDVLPVFQGCSGELCHAPWSYPTTVNVVAAECCDRRKIIEPGNPGGSYLLQKIRGIDLCGNSGKMGDVSPKAAQNIQDWICSGAPDN